jgi:integrase
MDRIRVDGRDYYLGRHGSDEARKEYARLCVVLAKDQPPEAILATANVLSVADLVAAYLRHAEQFYRDEHGRTSSELVNYRCAVEPLLSAHAHTAINEFGTKALRQVVETMVKKGWCRQSINRQLVRIRTVWRWAEAEQIAPAGCFATLKTVRGLKRGELGVDDSPEVLPVPEPDLEATLPHLTPPQVRALVELMVLTGARPGEVSRMTAEVIDKSGKIELAKGIWVELGSVWAYRPAWHKTLHHGHRRIILLGPQAQKILAPWLLLAAPGQYLFRPARGGRGLPAKPRYTREAMLGAVHRACVRANVKMWSPAQLRHNAATRFSAAFGLDITRVVLGQRSVRVTQGYALEDWQRAAAAMGRTG